MLWDQIKLSNQLVELRLQSVNFCGNSQLLDFLQALNSAPELRNLKIISVLVFPESSPGPPPVSRSVKCPVPKLQTLLLKDLDYSALQILQGSLTPGPYHTTLCLTEKITYIHEPREEPTIVDFKDLCKVLKRISVDKLVLCGEWEEKKAWLDHTGLRSLLQSLPTVKTLIMSYWKFHKDGPYRAAQSSSISAHRENTHHELLEIPQGGLACSRTTSIRRKGIQESNYAQMLDVEVLRSVVPSHKLQEMSLSGCVAPAHKNNSDTEDMDTDGSNSADDFKDSIDWHCFESKDKVVKWLKTQVARFYLEDVPKTESRDYETSEWEL
ncbi:hypothetical protein RSAG8_04108, partial [Rhizoctonia solani AG-8 WAC10335]